MGLASGSGTIFPSTGDSWTASLLDVAQVLTDYLCAVRGCPAFTACPGSLPLCPAVVPFCSSLKEDAWGFATTNTVLPPRLYLPSSAAYLCTPLKHKLAHLPYTPPRPQGGSLASQLRSWSHEPKTGPSRPESWDRSPDPGGTGVASEA